MPTLGLFHDDPASGGNHATRWHDCPLVFGMFLSPWETKVPFSQCLKGSSFFQPCSKRVGSGSSKDVVPGGQQGSSPSELIIILAVWVAVGKSGVTGSQGPQDVLQPASGLEDLGVWPGSLPTASELGVYLLLHRGRELGLEKWGQHLATHQHQALLLRDGVAGGQLGLAARDQAAEDVFILSCPGGRLAAYKRMEDITHPTTCSPCGKASLMRIAGQSGSDS